MLKDFILNLTKAEYKINLLMLGKKEALKDNKYCLFSLTGQEWRNCSILSYTDSRQFVSEKEIVELFEDKIEKIYPSLCKVGYYDFDKTGICGIYEDKLSDFVKDIELPKEYEYLLIKRFLQGYLTLTLNSTNTLTPTFKLRKAWTDINDIKRIEKEYLLKLVKETEYDYELKICEPDGLLGLLMMKED